jgi:UDP-3-O-acyl-N-acetylglucosamine deacetylase
VGDLALLGHPLDGHIHAVKAGHALHIEFARALARASEPARSAGQSNFLNQGQESSQSGRAAGAKS